MTDIPYRYGIDTLPINRNRNVKHKTETETERTPKKKEKKKFETSAFGGASRSLFFRDNPPNVVQVEAVQGAYEGRSGVGALTGRATSEERSVPRLPVLPS
jgi:hypothetical protein